MRGSTTNSAFGGVVLLVCLFLSPGGGQLRGGGVSNPFRSNSPQRVGGGGSLACPEKFGRFPHGTQCDAYIECEEGVPTEKLCPDGLLFNNRARHYAYPCQYPVDVDCEGRSGLQPPQPTEDCPHQYGYFRLGQDAADCSRFVNCVEGRGYHFECPEGLAFSADTLRCDWPDQVDSCDAEAFLQFTCPQVEGSFADGYRFYRSHTDCQKYFLCVGGRPRLYSCGQDEAYNEDIGACDGIENVTACAQPPLRAGSAPTLLRRN